MVYTQITDVESETNGLMTYDRERIKISTELFKAANDEHLSNPNNHCKMSMAEAQQCFCNTFHAICELMMDDPCNDEDVAI